MKQKEIINIARQTILTEAQIVNDLASNLNLDFANIINLIFKSTGRLIVTGIGKSANVANKIVSTLNSTGTPAIFMHAADAIHGDLGIILDDDIVLCLSKSGNTEEIKVLVPLIKKSGNKIIGIVANKESFLAKQADYIIHTPVTKEACPNNLVPTSSTTAQMVIGDAIAICLLNLRGFTSEDFAKFHPGGSLGKKLYTRVKDLYTDLDKAPKVYDDTMLDKIIIEISSKRLGATAVIDNNNNIKGIITDGDIRRMLEKGVDLSKIEAKSIKSEKPKTINMDELAINAFNLMKRNNITQIIVSEKNKYKGMLHLHDILKEGIV